MMKRISDPLKSFLRLKCVRSRGGNVAKSKGMINNMLSNYQSSPSPIETDTCEQYILLGNMCVYRRLTLLTMLLDSHSKYHDTTLLETEHKDCRNR